MTPPAEESKQMTAADELLREAQKEMTRWLSCQAIGACRQCADPDLLRRIAAHLAAGGGEFVVENCRFLPAGAECRGRWETDIGGYPRDPRQVWICPCLARSPGECKAREKP